MGDRRLGNYLKGAKGEEWVARELAFLPATFTVFNGIRMSDGQYNFDHILLGPSGVFVVETKNWTGRVVFSEGRVRVDEKEIKHSPLQQVKGEAAELDAFLQAQGHVGVPIQSVLCFLGSTLEEPITNVNGVVVCDGVSLTDVLTGELNEPVDSAILEAIEHSLMPLVG
ncbi:MAG: nuclease-related domain-containing protein [Pontiellaceae bacterium]